MLINTNYCVITGISQFIKTILFEHSDYQWILKLALFESIDQRLIVNIKSLFFDSLFRHFLTFYYLLRLINNTVLSSHQSHLPCWTLSNNIFKVMFSSQSNNFQCILYCVLNTSGDFKSFTTTLRVTVHRSWTTEA